MVNIVDNAPPLDMKRGSLGLPHNQQPQASAVDVMMTIRSGEGTGDQNNDSMITLTGPMFNQAAPGNSTLPALEARRSADDQTTTQMSAFH